MKNEWGQMLSRAKTAPLKLCKGSPDVLCGILQIFSFEEQNKMFINRQTPRLF